MHASDGSPIRPEETYDAQEHWIPYDRRQATVAFLLYDRYEIQRAASAMLRGNTGQGVSWQPPQLDLAPTAFVGLKEVANKRNAYMAQEQDFIQIRDGSITDLLTCGKLGSRPNPSCVHLFDYGSINAYARIELRSLRDWQAIRSLVERFIECAYVDEASVRKDGNPTWNRLLPETPQHFQPTRPRMREI